MYQDTMNPTTNGHTPLTRTVPETPSTTAVADWRTSLLICIADAASTEDGRPVFGLLAAIREHLPDLPVRVWYEDRSRAVRVLPEVLPRDLRTVVLPARDHNDEVKGQKPYPMFGWWEGTDETGQTYNAVLTPSNYGDGEWVVFGPEDDETLAAFLEKWTIISRGKRGWCRRFNGSWQDDPEMEAEVSKIDWSDVVLAEQTLTDVRRTIDQFFTQRDIFRTLKFPWRRGVLLVGPPGTGKTMVCKAAAASHPNVPFLYIGDLGSSNNRRIEIGAIFQYARECAPCILAFEDIDGLIDQSRRSVFLNELDGFRDNDGLLVIASSNHPERIDEALLKRPSRFDRVYHIGLPARAERMEYARRLLARTPNLSPSLDTELLAGQVADLTEGFTPAFLKEAFLSATLQMAQEGLTTLDDAFGAAVLEQVDALRRYLKKANTLGGLSDAIGTGGTEIGFRSR